MAKCKDRHFRRTKRKNIKSIQYLKSRKFFFPKQQIVKWCSNSKSQSFTWSLWPYFWLEGARTHFILFKPGLVFCFFSPSPSPQRILQVMDLVLHIVWERERIKVIFFLSLSNDHSRLSTPVAEQEGCPSLHWLCLLPIHPAVWEGARGCDQKEIQPEYTEK